MLAAHGKSNGLCIRKLDLDFRSQPSLGPGMESDTDDLVLLLCTQIGMLMEDASVVALTLKSREPDQRAAEIENLHAQISRMAKIIDAATALTH